MKKLLLTLALLLIPALALAGFQVTIEWSPNSESDLAGYYVYQAEASGGPYTKVGSVLPITSPKFTVPDLSYDTNYFWVVTAFDNETPFNESGYSNEVTIFKATPPDSGPPGTPQDINVILKIVVEIPQP